MEHLFDSVLKTSLSGGVIILVILALRPVLRNAPKRFLCLLWLLAVVRLLIPFSIESPLSLQPDPDRLQNAMVPDHSAVQEAFPPVSAVPDGDTPALPSPDSPDAVIGDADVSQPDIVTIDTAAIAATVWAIVACGFLGYMAVSYLLLKHKVRDAIPLDTNIFECSSIDSPFLLGYGRPNIYLPAGLPLQDLDPILAHEQAHIRRMDHWTKLLGYLCLSLHWFNPLVWAAYILLCRDIEMACDEEVVAAMDVSERKAYSAALLRCASGQRVSAVCPVAFGVISVKQRIPRVLNYRKPAFLLSLIAVAAVLVVAVCFLTDPSVPTQEELYLEQCREALEAWQSMESRHLRVENQYEGEEVLNDSSTVDFWRSGDRYLRHSFVPLSGSSRQVVHVLTDGNLLSRQYSAASEGYGFWASDWEENSVPASIVYSWVDTFDWDAHSIEFVSCQADDNMTVITLSVTEDPMGSDDTHKHNENPYTVSFCFAADGTLDHLVQTSWTEYETVIDNRTEYGVQWVVATYHLIPDDAEQIAAEIDRCYTNAKEETSAG